MIRPTLMTSLVLGGLMLQHSPAANADTIRCESQNGNYQSCQADTRGGVRLSRQLSSQGCWQNDTWGYDRNRIWVARGCRAEFQTNNGNSNSSSNTNNKAVVGAVVLALVGAAILANKNKDDRYDDTQYDNRYDHGYDNGYDNVYDNGYGNNYGNPRQTFTCESKNNKFTYCNQSASGHVEVYKQLSSAQCSYGQSWGMEGRRVWVSNGCRAEFAVY